MPKTRSTFDLPALDEPPRPPLRRWLYQQIRNAILDGRLQPGTRLPASRALATQYGLARGTVVEAFEQLSAEGYLRSRVGSGTYVNESLPDALLQIDPHTGRGRSADRTLPATVQPRALTKPAHENVFPRPDVDRHTLFNPYQPALDAFPVALWSRLLARRGRTMDQSLLGDGDPRGYLPLRRSIAQFLGASRGISADPDHILIVASVQQALDLSARLLLKPGDAAWIEDPGYPGARAVLKQARARLVPVPVDPAGIQVQTGRRLGGSARLAYVTPARQAPLGISLSLPRRMALLEWAAQAGAWIFEDDYDGEYRYQGRPLAPLQSLDREGCVLYAGSFSKTLFPALRISYLLLPPALVDAFTATRSLTSRFPPVLEQAVLADFIEQGHYARHLRRMNTLYGERRTAMVEAITTAPHVFGAVTGDEAGLSLVAWLRSGRSERDAVRAGRTRRLFVQGLSPYVMKRRLPPALVLGFAATTPRRIRAAMRSLVDAMG